MTSIWIKIGNIINNPKSWISQGYIGIINIRGINDKNYEWLESPNKIYSFASKLQPNDCIYVFEVKNNTSLLTYKFTICSLYSNQIHGYYIKNAYKCLDIVTQFTNGKNGRQRWAAKGGLILNKCNNPNIRWDLIKNFTNQVNLLDQEIKNVADIYKEGEITKNITIQFRGRSRKLKDAYLDEYGYDCKLCGKSYLKADGASHIIDIHHLKPIACGERKTDIHKDLKGLCPNCHRFIHSIKVFEKKTWEEIKDIFRKVNSK